jgi:hypothetical protein
MPSELNLNPSKVWRAFYFQLYYKMVSHFCNKIERCPLKDVTIFTNMLSYIIHALSTHCKYKSAYIPYIPVKKV